MAILLPLALLCSLLQESHTDETCKGAMEEFRNGLKSGDVAIRAAALRKLGEHRCPKSLSILSPFLVTDATELRIAAAEALGGFDDPKAVEAVRNAVNPNLKTPAVVGALAQALAKLDWEAGAETLNGLLSKEHDPEIQETLPEVLSALGSLGSSSSVDPIIDLLRDAESENKGPRPFRRRGVRGEHDADIRKLKEPCRKALEEITGHKDDTARAWDDWWKANKADLMAKRVVVYRCKETGKRFELGCREEPKCPNHDKPVNDGVVVKTKLR